MDPFVSISFVPVTSSSKLEYLLDFDDFTEFVELRDFKDLPFDSQFSTERE